MIAHRGLWLPEGDTAFIRVMEVEGLPLVDGKPTYQHRKYVATLNRAKSRRHAVDIGAHVGLWSRLMAIDFNHVTAFEPVPQYNECYELNLKERTNWTLHRIAIGAETKEVHLKIKASNSGITHIVGTPSEETLTVPMTTLDSLDLAPIDLLKIDCEGYEYFVLKGAEKTIRRDKPAIIIEQKASTKDRYGLEFKSAVRLLQTWGATHDMEVGGDHIMYWKDDP